MQNSVEVDGVNEHQLNTGTSPDRIVLSGQP